MKLITDTQGRVIALSNFLFPPWQISYRNYFLKDLLVIPISLIFICVFMRSFLPVHISIWPNFSLLIHVPHDADDIIGLFYITLFIIALIGWLLTFRSSWINSNIIQRGKPHNVEFTSKDATPLGYKLLSFKNLNDKWLQTYVMMQVSNNADLSLLTVGKTYKAFKGAAGKTTAYLIILDEAAFQNATAQQNSNNL